MKKTMMFGLLVALSVTMQAQLVQVVKCDRVQTGFYPVLNVDGTRMLFTSENYAGLSVCDLQTAQIQQLSTEANAGYEPMFSTDNTQVFFRTRTTVDGRGYLTVKAVNMATQKERVLLTPRREAGKLQQYGNGVVFSQQKQLRKATFGKSDAAVPNYVSNEDLKLVLYQNGKRIELYPHGQDVNYIWSSISPDGSKILFNTKLGTAICDLQGNIISSLGNLNAPVWYNNNLVLGMCDKDDGHTILSSVITMASADGAVRQTLTDGSEIAMYPTASAQSGKIAYNTLDGTIYLMEITLNK